MRIIILAGVLSLLCGSVAAAASAVPPAPPKAVLYRHVTLIDGTGAPAQKDMTIVTRSDRIAAVVPTARDGAYHTKNAKLVDMSGRYALPGLINSHVHMATAPNLPFAKALLRRNLYSGVTAVRDMAGDARVLAYLSRAALLGEIPSPDIYYAALMAGPEFFKDPRTVAAARGRKPGDVPWLRAVTDKTDMRLAIAEARGTGATGLKIYADLPGHLVKKITAEAHRQHMLVWTHAAIFPATPKQVLDAGTDVDSHVCMLAYQVSRDIPRAYHNRAPVNPARIGKMNVVIGGLFDQMHKNGTILDATLWIYPDMEREHEANAGSAAPYCSAALAERLTADAHAAKVMISTGTDGYAQWDSPFAAVYDEMALLVHKAGMTPLEAIQSATQIGAKTVGHEKDMGTIAPGKLANIMFTAKNPAAKIENLKSIVLTVKRGRSFPRKDYRPITRAEASGDL
ncbi:MAG TPA: amidohydrolase family protein [Rhizomicrobium sp.]|nr:amidohydrolase family protein [Rhizomicrobium sp.]